MEASDFDWKVTVSFLRMRSENTVNSHPKYCKIAKMSMISMVLT